MITVIYTFLNLFNYKRKKKFEKKYRVTKETLLTSQ